jgi:hypothetical protein
MGARQETEWAEVWPPRHVGSKNIRTGTVDCKPNELHDTPPLLATPPFPPPQMSALHNVSIGTDGQGM